MDSRPARVRADHGVCRAWSWPLLVCSVSQESTAIRDTMRGLSQAVNPGRTISSWVGVSARNVGATAAWAAVLLRYAQRSRRAGHVRAVREPGRLHPPGPRAPRVVPGDAHRRL